MVGVAKREKWNSESRMTTCYMHAPIVNLRTIFKLRIVWEGPFCFVYFLFIFWLPSGWMTRANFNLPTSSFIFFPSHLPKGFGIIQNGGIYSEYGRLKTDWRCCSYLRQQPYIYTNTGKWLLPGSHDIMASLCWLHRLCKCVSLYFPTPRSRKWSRAINWIERGNHIFFVRGRERKLRKEVSDTSNTYPISLE